MRGMLSHLSRACVECLLASRSVVRSGCRPAAQQSAECGTLTSSPSVGNALKAYDNAAQSEGSHEVSTVPLPAHIVTELLECADRKIEGLLTLQHSTSVPHYRDWLLLERDAAAFAVLGH